MIMKKFIAYLLFSFLIVSLFACSSKDNTTTAPLPPSISGVQFRADAGNQEATLDWQMIADATSYNIYYISSATNPGSTIMKASGTKVTGLIGPRYTVTGLTNNTKYWWFALSAVNANGESDLSTPIPASPNFPPPPPAPTNIRANAGDKTVTVTWNIVPGASSYNLHCIDLLSGTSIIPEATSPYVVNTLIWNVGTDTETPPTELLNGRQYIFWLTAKTAESGPSAVVSATPGTASINTESNGAAVTSITATVTTGTTGQVTISWVPLSSETFNTSYTLYYYPTPTPGNLTKIPEFVNSVVSGLTDGTSYSFYLTSVTSSSASFEVTATPTPSTNPLPAAPTLVSATPGDGNVTLTWTAVTGATSYNIYWSTLPDVTKTIGAATKGLSATSPLTTAVTLANGTKYYFVVTAVNANGESMESNERYTTPPSGPSSP